MDVNIVIVDFQVELGDVMTTIEEHLQYRNGKLLGLFSAVSHLMVMYRWGELPCTLEQDQISSIQFPVEINEPFKKVSNSPMPPHQSKLHSSPKEVHMKTTLIFCGP